MTQSGLGDMSKAAQRLSRNPLGIIALFIVLVYAMATLVVTLGTDFSGGQRWVFTVFLVAFPVIVLFVFSWLVSNHSAKLFGPGDYKDDRSFLESLTMTSTFLAAASQQSDEGGSPNASTEEQDTKLRSIAQAAQFALSSENSKILRSSSILWVDDRGRNGNRWLRGAFQEVGIEVQLALSTQEAVDVLKKQAFGAIISDMRRPEGEREGHVLLRRVRNELKLRTPFFVHTGQNDKAVRDETMSLGGDGQTGDPQVLFTITIQALGIGAFAR